MNYTFEDVEENIKKKKQILFTRKSTCIKELQAMIAEQKHATMIMWAMNCLSLTLQELERICPNNPAFAHAIDESKRWARGEIKMPQAKRAILDCHAQAKEMQDKCAIALCHAIGQGCGTVHVESHALGLPFYELSAIVYKHKCKGYEKAIEDKLNYYKERLLYWQSQEENLLKKQTWASFITKEKVNKEKQVLLKTNK